jgi:hypothetical protein
MKHYLKDRLYFVQLEELNMACLFGESFTNAINERKVDKKSRILSIFCIASCTTRFNVWAVQ